MFSYVQLFNGFVWIDHEVNKSEIIRKFCENKDKPEMKCEGTCHMKKMMIDDEGDDQGPKLVELPEILLYSKEFPIEVMNQELTLRTNYFFYRVNYNEGFLDEIDIPPRA
jgi:hypothetical protein